MTDLNNDKLIRILAIAEFPIHYENGRFGGKAGEIFETLNHGDFQVVDYLVPRLKGWMRTYNQLRSFSFDQNTWRRNISLSPRAFDLRTQLIERFIQSRSNSFDIIFQLLALFAPGTNYKNRRYIVSTDNTFLLTQRHWPKWTPPMSQSVKAQWIQRETELYQNAAYLFPWGENARQSMINDYHISPDKVIATGMSGNLPPAPPEAIAAHCYDQQTALFVGYEFERKGGHTLLAAWEKVHRHLPKARLIIAGPAKPEASPMPGVTWVGSIGQKKLGELLTDATLFVMPSHFEPWGLVFHEAMSYGVPCIGTATGAMPEFIHDGKNGALVPVGDSEQLADKLIAILGNPDHAAQLGKNAYATFNEEYTWEKVAGRMKPHLYRIMQ